MSSTTAATATELAAHMAGTHAGDDDDAGRQQRTTPVQTLLCSGAGFRSRCPMNIFSDVGEDQSRRNIGDAIM